VMAHWVRSASLREPDRAVVEKAVQACEPKVAKGHGGLEPLREKLYETMWQKVGIIRDAAGLRSALADLDRIEKDLLETGIADANRAFNLTWHDWLNLKSLVQVSRAIAEAALAREDSRGAHFREDYPETGPLEASAFTSLSRAGERLQIEMKPVAFTRVRPGQSLLA